MDQQTAPTGQPDNQHLFKSENDASPGGMAAAESVAEGPNVATSQTLPDSSTSQKAQPESITWTASEFVARHKSFGWYLLLVVVAAVLTVGVWFATRDIFAAAMVFVGILLLGVYGALKPREVTYELTGQGLTIGSQHHTFREFRSFSVIPEGAFSSIELTPLRRFAMYTTIYYDPADENKIVDLLSRYLPIEERQGDLIDQLMRSIRF